MPLYNVRLTLYECEVEAMNDEDAIEKAQSLLEKERPFSSWAVLNEATWIVELLEDTSVAISESLPLPPPSKEPELPES